MILVHVEVARNIKSAVDEMSKAYDFIKECGVFFVLTISNGLPVGRPFGAIIEWNNFLYISTADTKEVYRQLKFNKNIQIVALKQGTRNWIRVNGRAEECFDLKIKEKILNECPVLKKHHDSIYEPHFNIFQIEIINAEFN